MRERGNNYGLIQLALIACIVGLVFGHQEGWAIFFAVILVASIL